jgi:hypothetical protein
MKIMIALLLPVALSGCMLELLTTTAIQGELAARDAQAGVQALNYAKESKAKTEAEYAIRAYQAEKGSYPLSLAALVPDYLPGVPTHADGSPFGYDAATGTLLDSAATPQRIPNEEDRRNLKRIEDAIYAYWQATANYPQTLVELQPLYIDKVPALSSGGSFIYDAQTGAVHSPGDFHAPVFSGARVAAGGAGPLGEATSGIAIQNQLRDMNTSGAQAAHGAAGRGLQGVDRAYQQQQQRALDNINQ